ncbi:hypothetical protein DCAR_0309867 [Daucus carota subsp. sativus]|uniref:TIR domain-containing protein n=1 Tax=Daucus carota subsp. sativus TaxID=79200 RepID=A0AAF0WLU3_DAUCS|nr:hypothetical protein DCAR_0309867 [Daucus carota subsp. sativus]
MATTSKQSAAPHCSSSSSSSTHWDVFLSFYGKDTRGKFTSHLYSALVREGISTFMDDPELEKGEEISSGLLNAIRGSKIFVVVLSENYARSRWCLDELVEILTCKRTSGRLVIPVFYYADPSYLRHLKGSYGDAMDVHKERYSADIIGKWRSALAEIAGLSGYHLKMDADENEAYTVQEIVYHVTPFISTKKLYFEEYLVGVDSCVEEICEKLSLESNDVRVVGVCGMGGIGKTTTVKAFYNKYFKKFDISCFVDDVKQHSQGGSYLLPILQQLSVKIFGKMDYKVRDVESGIRLLEQFLSGKKALLVVDDLDQSSYSDLVRVCKLFFPGSRIIFTTRDANILNQLKKDIPEVDIYMRVLEQVDSLKLFSYHAFRTPSAPESFKELTESFISYAGGLPLALKVLGSSLLNRDDMSFWKEKLVKVRKIGENDIQKIIQLSFDELGETEKAIFLDIAFFFVGKDKDEAVHIFKSCDFFPDVGIPVLVEKCLLTVTKNNMFQMHNIIRDMGKEVIRGESKHGGRRLYLRQENAWAALQNPEGLQKVEGLIIDQTMSTKRHFSAKILERMPNLRLLEIIGANDIEGKFRNSFNELRCIRWRHCPWTRLPSSFHPPKLVSLDMPYSELKTLWKGITPSVKLKTINLSYSKNLKIMPDLSNFTLLDKLLLHGCKSLLKVPQTIGQLTNLFHLDLGGCSHLKEVTEPIGQLTKLGHLDLDGCVNLRRLPEAIIQLTTIGSLNLSYCSNLTRLPEQLGDMKCLKMLDASYTSIEQLPDSTSQLKKLVKLNLSSCEKLRKLPEQIGNLESLKWFDASCTSIEQLPDSTAQLKKLVELKLLFCEKLRKLPEQIGNLESLKYLYASGSAIEHLPDTFAGLVNLDRLDLYKCAELEQLPEQFGKMQLQKLDLRCCRKVKNITSLAKLYQHQEGMDTINLPDMIKDKKVLKDLSLTCDESLCLWLPMILSFSSLEKLSLHFESQSFSPSEPYSLSALSSLQDLTLVNRKNSECCFPELPLNLTWLKIYGYATLEMLPDLSSLIQLKWLYIWRAISLQSLPSLPPHLEYLHVVGCTSLQDLPDLSVYKELRSLRVSMYSNPNPISLKQSLLQVCWCCSLSLSKFISSKITTHTCTNLSIFFNVTGRTT